MSQSSIPTKLRIAVIYGGRSGEHDVSRMSAASIVKNLDQDKYDIIPVSVNKEGQWLLNDLSVLPAPDARSLAIINEHSTEAIPHGDPQQERYFDVVFPIIHGVLGEDGTLQGLLEMADLPYVGCGVLASSICMDKDVAKRLARDAGIPIVPYVVIRTQEIAQPDAVLKKVTAELKFPVFVKPSNAGSSEGVTKVHSPEELLPAIQFALHYDRKVLVEKAVNAREIELSVLESLSPDHAPLVSQVAGEIVTLTREFYSYEAKYLDKDASRLDIPAHITETQLTLLKNYAARAFTAFECEGMARVDFFMDKETGEIFFNEVNTLPGFTEISLYPKLWEASGLPYQDLLSHLIELAVRKHKEKHQLNYLSHNH
jgi:D-alanine-D-alanine ligase